MFAKQDFEIVPSVLVPHRKQTTSSSVKPASTELLSILSMTLWTRTSSWGPKKHHGRSSNAVGYEKIKFPTWESHRTYNMKHAIFLRLNLSFSDIFFFISILFYMQGCVCRALYILYTPLPAVISQGSSHGHRQICKERVTSDISSRTGTRNLQQHREMSSAHIANKILAVKQVSVSLKFYAANWTRLTHY